MSGQNKNFQILGVVAFSMLILLAQLGLSLASKPYFVSRGGVLTEKFSRMAMQEPLHFWPLVIYLMAIIALHLIAFLSSYVLWNAAIKLIYPRWQGKLIPLYGFIFLVFFVVALWNIKTFPLSQAFPGSDAILMQRGGMGLLWGGSIIVAFVFASGFISLLMRKSYFFPGFFLLVLLASLTPFEKIFFGGTFVSGPPIKKIGSKPSVIMIGVDSLRPDFLNIHGYPDKDLMPFINDLASNYVMLDDALVPLARTFVSYMSIFTGKYPVNHGARFNLYPRELFDQSDNIINRLKENGYFSAYTTDETRFANFDETFGFDLLDYPPMGVNDFILGSSYDSIVTNPIAATKLGQWIFPHLHGNRAAYRTYIPRNHAQRVDRLISKLPNDRPLLFVAHYCLPHWPYVHSVQDYGYAEPQKPDGVWHDAPRDYMRALQAVDGQISQNFEMLKSRGFLENAIVVLFSDHGEGLGMDKDFLEGEGFVQSLVSNGHGSNALGDTQQRVVLGFQRYINGAPQWAPAVLKGPASLIDVAPTLMSFMDFEGESYEGFDGVNLRAAIENQNDLSMDRMRFIETGLSSAVIEADKIDEDAVAREFMHLYVLKSDFRVEIDPSYIQSRINSKQRGVYYNGLGLAAIRGFTDAEDCWVMADFSTRKMRCLREIEDYPVAAKMRRAACDHFKNDNGFLERWCQGVLDGI